MNNYLPTEQYFNIKIRNNLNNHKLNDFFALFNVAKAKRNYLVENNCCYLNGNLASGETILKSGDYLMIDISSFERNIYPPLDLPLDILYEDDYLLVVNKPTNFIIYSLNQEENHTMANIVSNYYLQHQLNRTIRHCHRLDLDTTGCLIYAKDLFTQSAIEKLFENHLIEKSYLAIVEGEVLTNNTIKSAIGKDRHINGKMIIKKTGPLSKTTYEVVSANKRVSFLKVKIDTGKTHQIRVHLASINHPLYGDTLYGAISNSRVMLHCIGISFIHPILGKKMQIIAPIPKDFKNILKKENLSCDKIKNLL